MQSTARSRRQIPAQLAFRGLWFFFLRLDLSLEQSRLLFADLFLQGLGDPASTPGSGSVSMCAQHQV